MQSLEMMADVFSMRMSFNTELAVFYVFFKLMVIAATFTQWLYLCIIFGPEYQLYGVNVVTASLYQSWPMPTDVLFPKMAKCEFTYVGSAGDVTVASLLCDVPVNHIIQWTFFFFWIWMPLTTMLNVCSFFFVFFMWLCDKSGISHIKFADWLLLRFVEINLNASEYVSFVKILTEMYSKIHLTARNVSE